MPEKWDSVGIEIEYVDVDPKQDPDLRVLLEDCGYKITHDASVESPTMTLSGCPVKGATFDKEINDTILRKSVIGGELVSPILDTSFTYWIEDISNIFKKLRHLGERVNTTRGSIHVHVNFPVDHPSERRHSLGILRRAWILAGFTEAFFYRIGGLGKEQRGKFMDYIYYRPIVGNGPPIAMGMDGEHRPVLKYEDVLKSSNYVEFMHRCGDIYNAGDRYHPCRYFWINFYNLRTSDRPHIEFRVFNKTMRWDYVYAIVELCKAFVKICYCVDTETVLRETKGNVFGLNTCLDLEWDSYYNSVIKLLRITDENILLILRNIWNKTPIPYYEDMPVYSHLSRSTIFNPRAGNNGEWYPTPLSSKERRKVRYANYIDVHKLTEMGEYIFPEENDGCVN